MLKQNRARISALVLCAASLAGAQAVERIWGSRIAPGSTASVMTDTVHNPYVRIFLPTAGTANGAAMVICPGGGYSSIAAIAREGTNPAAWFTARGFATFVLRYRMGSSAGGSYRYPVQLWDVQRAVRWVRANAKRFGVDTARVGVSGYSAGGHLAAMAATHWDAGYPDPTSPHYFTGAKDSVDGYSSRPAFQILLYPVITMEASFTHAGSRSNLLGSSPSTTLVNFTSNEKQVAADTPPAYFAHGIDDATVPVLNSRAYRDSLAKKGVRHLYREFTSGPHGFGLADGQAGAPNNATLATWPTQSIAWLDSLGMRTPTAVAPGKVQARAGASRDGLLLKNGQVIAMPKNGAEPADLRGRVVTDPVR